MAKITYKHISQTIKEIGIPANLKGYKYIIKALEMINQDETLIDSMTKRLYPEVAECFEGATGSRVERAIRHAIEIGFDYSSADTIYKFFGNCFSSSKGKPTNSEFLATVYEYMKNEEE